MLGAAGGAYAAAASPALWDGLQRRRAAAVSAAGGAGVTCDALNEKDETQDFLGLLGTPTVGS